MNEETPRCEDCRYYQKASPYDKCNHPSGGIYCAHARADERLYCGWRGKYFSAADKQKDFHIQKVE